MKKITIHNYPLDNIDTDRIIPGKYTKTLNPQDLIDHCLEDLDPTFKSRVGKGDFLAGGNNFGCGSSREQAPLALKLSGIDTIIAKSFARIFYRNAINIGLQLLEIPEFDISESAVNGNFDEKTGKIRINDRDYLSKPLPSIMKSIIDNGGLVAYLKKYKQYRIN